jgi:hypothetical protein
MVSLKARNTTGGMTPIQQLKRKRLQLAQNALGRHRDAAATESSSGPGAPAPTVDGPAGKKPTGKRPTARKRAGHPCSRLPLVQVFSESSSVKPSLDHVPMEHDNVRSKYVIFVAASRPCPRLAPVVVRALT